MFYRGYLLVIKFKRNVVFVSIVFVFFLLNLKIVKKTFSVFVAFVAMRLRQPRFTKQRNIGTNGTGVPIYA